MTDLQRTLAGRQLLWFLACKASAAEYSFVDQINETHVAFIKRIMASRCTSLLRLLSKLSVHGEPLLENDAPIGGQIFDRINGEPDLFDQLGEWQAAMQALLLVAEQDGPPMFARIGIMRALNRGHIREFNTSRKDTHWGRRKLARNR